jgi:hypothetical protein
MPLFHRDGLIDFDAVRDTARSNALAICRRLFPGGIVRGREYVVRNPKRDDRRAGSFSVNITTGRWGDFATGDRGSDIIGLVAWYCDIDRVEAARWLSKMLGLSEGEGK